jgi:hypothetical protein
MVRSLEQRVVALRRRADETKLPWERAGEELLIGQGSWIRRDDFWARVVAVDDDGATIRWERAGEVLAEAVAGSVAADDVVVLAFAVALGTDRFGLSQMDADRQRRMLAAVASVVRDWQDDEHGSGSLSAVLRSSDAVDENIDPSSSGRRSVSACRIGTLTTTEHVPAGQ